MLLICGAQALSFACSSLVGGMLFGESGLLLVLLLPVESHCPVLLVVSIAAGV